MGLNFLLLVSLTTLGAGVRIYSPVDDATTGLGKIYSPTYQYMYPYTDPSAWNRNYTMNIAVDYAGCFPSIQPNIQGKVIWYYLSIHCPLFGLGYPATEQWSAWQNAGAAGVLLSDFASTLFTSSAYTPYGPNPGDVGLNIPVLGMTYYQDWNAEPQPFDPVAFVIFLVDPATNFTVSMDFPDTNSLRQDFIYPSGPGFLRWSSVAIALFCLLFSVTKLFMFISHEGGIKITSLAQQCLALLVLSSFWFFFYINFGPWFGGNILPDTPALFFQTHFYPYWVSALTLYSFYLVEVSFITGAVSGLEKFKWPALAVCGGLFVIEIVSAVYYAFNPPGSNYTTIAYLQGCTYLIAMGLVALLFIFANVMLLRSMMAAGGISQNASLLRLVVFNGVLLICVAFSMINFGMFAADHFKTGAFPAWSLSPEFCLWASSMWFGSGACIILMTQAFRISVQKEIEISKSGTSSTSGSSGSSSSSSSSSSANDPVIEL